MEERNPKSDRLAVLIGWLLVLVISAVLVLASLPRMRQAFADSGMITLVREHRASQASGDSVRTANIVFPVPGRSTGTYTFRTYAMAIEGTLSRHERVERLLEGPPVQALRDGAVTFIPSDTKLIGLSVSSQIIFIDLSKEFLGAHDWDDDFSLRREQVRRTLMQESGIRDVVILVEGKLSDHNQAEDPASW